MPSQSPQWLYVVNNLSVLVDLIMLTGVFLASRKIENQYRKVAFWSFTLFIGAWLLLTTTLAKQGAFVPVPGRFNPILPVLLAGLLGSYFLFTQWKIFKVLLSSIPTNWIVLIQFFRILGGIFLILLGQQLLPPQFALPAGIGDVSIGLSAILVSWALHRKKTWASTATRWWCYLGILDLVIAVTMGALSSPSSLQRLVTLPFEPTNYLIGTYPLVMIPIFRVPFAVTMHLLVLKRLGRQPVTVGTLQTS